MAACCNCFHKEAAPGRKQCPDCLQRNRKSKAKISAARKALGLCRCGAQIDNIRWKLCSKCRERSNYMLKTKELRDGKQR